MGVGCSALVVTSRSPWLGFRRRYWFDRRGFKRSRPLWVRHNRLRARGRRRGALRVGAERLEWFGWHHRRWGDGHEFGDAMLMSARAESGSRSMARSPSETTPTGWSPSQIGRRHSAFPRMTHTAFSMLSAGASVVSSVTKTGVGRVAVFGYSSHDDVPGR